MIRPGQMGVETPTNTMPVYYSGHNTTTYFPTQTRLRYQKNVWGLLLQGQLFGRAVELVAAIPSNILCSDDGAFAVANAIHKIRRSLRDYRCVPSVLFRY